MICPTCNTLIDPWAGPCPACQTVPASCAITVGEPPRAPTASSARGDDAGRPSSTPPTSVVAEGEARILAPVRGLVLTDTKVPAPTLAPAHPVLAALPQVPALLWRQPMVRSAVRTGASAVALTLAARLLRRVVASQALGSVSAESAMPALTELLAPPQRRARSRRHRQSAEISETLIYIRRVTHP